MIIREAFDRAISRNVWNVEAQDIELWSFRAYRALDSEKTIKYLELLLERLWLKWRFAESDNERASLANEIALLVGGIGFVRMVVQDYWVDEQVLAAKYNA